MIELRPFAIAFLCALIPIGVAFIYAKWVA